MSDPGTRIQTNLSDIRDRIAEAAGGSGRSASEIRLVAVTKKNAPERIVPLIEAGQRDLGENFPQELWRKADAMADRAIHWHLIGHLQSNKARRTLPMVRFIHGVDSLKLLRLLDELAADADEPPSACLQVNCSGEESKHGWSPEALLDDADLIAECRHLPIVGLMTIAGYGTTNDEARPAFERLRRLRDQLRERTGLPLPELSMGMSGDFEAAILEGSTLVRIGSALFEGVEGP